MPSLAIISYSTLGAAASLRTQWFLQIKLPDSSLWSKAIGANPTLKFQPLNTLRWMAFFLQMSSQWRLWPLCDILFECYWWEYGKSHQLMVFKKIILKKIKSNHKACIIYYCIRHTPKLYVALQLFVHHRCWLDQWKKALAISLWQKYCSWYSLPWWALLRLKGSTVPKCQWW